MQGIILKGYSGHYYVYAEDRVWECSLRGRFRISEQEFLPGDRVRIQAGQGHKATIEVVESRHNYLIRPSIANVDQALLVFAMTSPEPDYNLLDRLLVQVEFTEIQPILVFTKADICQSEPEQEKQWQIYANFGYTLIKVSNKSGEGIESLKEILAGKTSVLAGPSGVGKSSLLNSLSPELERKTGEVGKKLKRGRHTTRHVELVVCAGGLIADTPGFSSLNLPEMRREALAEYFPEFQPLLNKCRFSSCLHHREPDCAVKEAVASGKIHESRYDHYLIFLQEVITAERRF